MRIEHIRVAGFGRLTGFDTGPSRLGPLVVVLGSNEAGKSTLFSFLTTALYGFQPASRDLSPFVPWGADEAGGEVVVRLADGSCATVSRRLRSSPTGTVTVGDVVEELRNRPVRWVGHVPRSVFRQVFAITLAELAGLDGDTWAGIQDRVLGSMGASDLRSAREVAEVLEREAAEIWRPNRRGNQALRDLQDDLRALRERRAEALSRDREVRRLVGERESVRLRLDDARRDRQREKVEIEHVQELIPVKRQLDRIASLRRSGGPRDALVGLPRNLEEHLQRLAARKNDLGRSITRIAGEEEPLRAAVDRYDTDRRALVARRGELRSFVERATEARADRDGLREARTEREELGVQLRTQADQLLVAPWGSDELRTRVSAVSIDLLRDRIDRLAAAEAHARDAPASVRSGLAGRSSLLLVGVGAALLAWGTAGGPVPAVIAGASALAVGVTIALRRTAPTAPSSDAAGTARREVDALLSGVPIREDLLDPPGPALVGALARLKELAESEARVGRRERRHAERLAELESEAERVRDLAGPEGPNDSFELALALERRLREAESAKEGSREGARALSALVERRRAAEVMLDDVEQELEALDLRLRTLAESPVVPAGRGDALTAVAAAQRRLDDHGRADDLEEELRRAHPDLDGLIDRIEAAEARGASWAIDDEELTARKVRLEHLDATVEDLVARAQALDGEVGRLRDMETVDAIDSEAESLREDQARLVRERDRKWLLARLVREADRRFREEHQPDLLRRASGYLARLTGGRYDRLLVDEDAPGDLFQIVGPGLPAPVSLAAPISTGTLEQAYLGLRLAIVDHLDHGQERLPLFMDEALVNWDSTRRARGLEALAEVSRARQVFAFTCHPEMADDLASRGACVLRLDPD